MPTTSNTVYSASTSSATGSRELEYTVTNSINTVVVAITGSGNGCYGWGNTYGPSGGTENLFAQDPEQNMVYYYTYQNQVPGNYGIMLPDGNCSPPGSDAVYVFENNVVTPTPNPTYYFTSYTTPSVTAPTIPKKALCDCLFRICIFDFLFAQ